MYKNIFSIETLKNSVGRRLLVKIAFTHKNLLSNLLVGSLASEFLGWSWKPHVGIPMLDIGIPTLEFQCPT